MHFALIIINMKTSGLAGTLKSGIGRSRLQLGATPRERKPLPFTIEDLEQVVFS